MRRAFSVPTQLGPVGEVCYWGFKAREKHGQGGVPGCAVREGWKWWDHSGKGWPRPEVREQGMLRNGSRGKTP